MDKEGLKEWIKYNKSKTGALIVSFLYLVLGIFSGTLKDLIALFVFLGLSLACIFFGDIMGGAMGRGRGGGVPAVNTRVPGGLMVFIGWVLLLTPVCGAILMAIFK